MRNFKGTLAAAAVAVVIVGGASAANAAVVFSDTFEEDTLGLNASLTKWDVTAGSIDVIGTSASPYNLVPAEDNSLYLDLNGSTATPGAISTMETFAAGTYVLTFDLGGQNRPYDKTTKSVTVSLGDWSETLSPVWNAAFTMETFTVMTTTSGGALSFAMNDVGNPNVGDLLDNVVLTAVPEASTWVMLLAGFAGLGFAAFRKSNKAPVAIA